MIYILPVLGVLLSFLFVVIAKPTKNEYFKLLLAFSGAFLLALTIFEMLPEIYTVTDARTVGVFVMMGILFQIFLEFFSKGAEHGHVHISKDSKAFPWLLFISLCIHSVLEGLPIISNDTIIYGILIHKIPIAIILSIFLLGSKIKRLNAGWFMLLFSIMTPLGTLLANTIEAFATYATYLNALVIGVFLHISTVILFESSEGHKFNLRKLLVIVFGVIIAYFL